MIKPEIIQETTSTVFTSDRFNQHKNTATTFEDIQNLHKKLNQLSYVESSQDLYNQALDILIELTDAESGTYFHIDSDTRELLVAAVQGDQNSQALPAVFSIHQKRPGNQGKIFG